MKTITLSLLLTTLTAFGENGQPVPIGSNILPEVTFSIGEPNATETNLENLRITNFRDGEFAGQVLVVMYYAAW